MDEEQIKSLYEKYWKCMIDKDAASLREMMSEDFYLMHMTGVKQSVDQFLFGLMNGTFNYYSASHDAIEITVDGQNASLVGKSKVLAAVYGGGKNLWRLQGFFTLRKLGDSWELTSSRVSTY